MNEQKICPLLGAGPLGINTNCKEGCCAWWDEEDCAIITIAQSLQGLDRGGIVTYPIERKEAAP